MLAAEHPLVATIVHFTRQRLRHLSAVLLLAWLLSLVAGVAQACVTHQALAHAHGAGHCATAAVSMADGEALASSAVKAACYKFCTDATVPTPKSEPSQDASGAILALYAIPLVRDLVFDADPAIAHAAAPPGSADVPGRRVPIPIAFLRLAL